MTTPSKRARENRKARKKRDKAERRWEKREAGPQEVPVSTMAEMMDLTSPSVDEILENMANGGGRVSEGGPGGSGIPAKLFVGGLSYDTDSTQLRAVFEQFGEVTEAVVIRDRDTNRSRGFGFATMASHKDAPKAIKALDGSELHGRRIVVNLATERR